MKRKIVIFGVGDFARIAHYYFKHDTGHEVVAFTVTQGVYEGTEFNGLPVVPFETIAATHDPAAHSLYVGVAYSKINKARTDLFLKAKALGYHMISYVCTKATTWPDLSIGEGTFIFENNVVQPYVKIGSNVVLWSGNHIGHDSIIGDNVFIASHVVVSGNCRVGDNTFMGVNCTLRDGITIGKNCVIGAGTVILKDVPDNSVVKAVNTPVADFSSDALKKI